MSDVFEFDPIDAEIISRMYKQRMPARAIARLVGKPPVQVSQYINKFLVKRRRPQAVVNNDESEVIYGFNERTKLARVGGIRHHNDPLAAKEGSRMLLEALAAYFEKRERQTT